MRHAPSPEWGRRKRRAGESRVISWNDPAAGEVLDELVVDRLSMAGPLLGATGWIDRLARLVRIDMATPPLHGYHQYSGLLHDLFAPLGFGLRRIPLPGAPAGLRENLIAKRRTGRPVCSIPILMDAAPVAEGWTRPALAMTRDGHRLYGLGTTGAKGAIAAVWAALRVADAVGLRLRFDPVLMFIPAGEGAGAAGLRHLAELGMVQGHVLCLTGPAAPRIWAGCLGSLDLEINLTCCRGKAAGQGSATALARPVLSALAALQGELRQRHSRLPAPPELGGGSLRPRLTVVSARATEGAEGQPRCTLLVNRRFTAEEGYPSARQELLDTVRQGARNAPGCAVESQVVRHLSPVSDPDHGPNGPRWRQALSWGFGFSPESYRRWGGTEENALGFVQQAGVREILAGGLMRPGQQAGAPDEHTTIEDVEALARAVLAYLADIPQIPAY